MKVAITIPAYNEEKTITRVISEINNAMSGKGYTYFIHVFDDGSKDMTAAAAKKSGAIVTSHRRNMGLAQTFRDEMKRCIELNADVIVHTDADGQYIASGIPRLLKKISEGYDLVLGSRFRGRIESMPIMKRLGNKAFALAISKMTGVRITDSTTGFRAFTREVAEEIEYINRFTYTQEQIIKASKKKFRIAEIPIDARKTRDSRLFGSSFEYAVKAWINILRIYRDFDPLKFFGVIGICLMGLGIFGGILLVALSFNDMINLDNHVPSLILVMMLFMTGLQVLLFGFLADKNEK